MTKDERSLWFAVFGAAYVDAVKARARLANDHPLRRAAEESSFAEEAAGLATRAVEDMRETYGRGGGCEGFGPEWLSLHLSQRFLESTEGRS